MRVYTCTVELLWIPKSELTSFKLISYYERQIHFA